MNAMSKNTTYTVSIDLDKAGKRLDRALADALPILSRSRIKVLMENGYVSRGDGDPVTDPAVKANRGEIIVLELPVPLQAKPIPQDIPLDIIFEDKHLIVIDKPAGLVVHPSAGHRDGTLVNALLHHCDGQLSGIGGFSRPGIVHRLDKDTSGLLVASKNDISHQGLSEQFARHDIERAYKALVWGTPLEKSGKVSGNIGRSPRNRKKMAVVQRGGKAAITHYRTLDIFGNLAALVECRLETGRTHQIRVHMSSIGHSVIGDPLYGGGIRRCPASVNSDLRQNLQNINGQLLHAYLLSFLHPITRKSLRFKSNNISEINSIIRILEGR
mgnify:CR=1 FL=1